MPKCPIFYDTVTLSSSRELTAEGYLMANAQFARAGIQEYSIGELLKFGISVPESFDSQEQTVKILRPEDEVFDDKSMSSFARKPITNEHPSDLVTAKNFRSFQIGLTGDTVVRVQDVLQTRIMLQDSDAIALVGQGKQQLSAGYTANIIWESGDSAYGAYDGKQTEIRGNHIAIVDRGRAGSNIRIIDSSDDDCVEENMDSEKLAEELAEAKRTIDALTGKIDGLNKILDARQQEHEKALQDAIRDGIECAMAAKILDPEIKVEGKSATAIRAEVLAKQLPAVKLADQSEDYIRAAFDVLVEQRRQATVRDSIKGLSSDLQSSSESPFTVIRSKFLNRHNSSGGK